MRQQDFMGIPIVRSDLVPRNKIYLINTNMIVWGTWTLKVPSVAASIKFQRRRRRK